MGKIVMVVWDMDGTLADLYATPDWLARLRSEDPGPYAEAPALLDMEALTPILESLMAQGIENNVVTWLSKFASESYKREVRTAKKNWLEAQNFPYNHFHGVQYGATKADSVRRALNDGDMAVLIDDDPKVRKGWNLGPALDPGADDIISFLAGLLGGVDDE